MSAQELAKASGKASHAEVDSILEGLSMLGLVVVKRDGERVMWNAAKTA